MLNNSQIYYLLAGDHQILLSLSNKNRHNSVHIPTILNSGMSNYCFINRNDFQTYIAYLKTHFRALARKDMKFRILSENVVVIKIKMDNGQHTSIIMRKVLYCSDFVVNLISIHVITGIHIRRMYYLSENSMTSILAMRAKLRKIAVRMNIQYKRLGHIDKRTIKILI